MYKQHAYLTFGGGIGPNEGFEDWATGVRLSIEQVGANSVPPVAAMKEYLEDNISGPLVDFFKNTVTHISGAASLQWAKFNMIGEDGKYLADETVQKDFTNVRGGGATSAQTLIYPSQVSLVATLETGSARGYANKGRMYLPCPNVTLGADGLIPVGQAEQVASATAYFLGEISDNVISGLLNYSFKPAVESKLGNGGDGTERIITRVSVDTRLDIQRSRAKSLRGARVGVDVG